MPLFKIETNVPKSLIPEDFLTKAVPVFANTLGKPEQLCVVSITSDLQMRFGESTEPCAIATLVSIGGLGLEENKKHAKVLSELIERELGVKNDRMYISFQDQPSSDIGYRGTTFHTIIG